jgi:hypothetical protein
MTAVIQADSFIETGSCDGPRYNRNAPSRETPGVLMNEMDKYTTEFELPYRNVERYIKEIGNNWNRLDKKQRSLVKTSFQNMGMLGKIESFGNVGGISPGNLVCNCKDNDRKNCTCKERFGDTTNTSPPGSTTVSNFIAYLATAPDDNTYAFMDTLWNTPSEKASQLGITSDQLFQIKDSMYQWSVDNSYALHSNWKSGLIASGWLFFLILLFVLIGLAIASGSGGGSGGGSETAFGKSLFKKKW